MATRTFEHHPISLYFNLIEWLQALKMRSTRAHQWIASILSAKGIREEEIEQSGLISFLNEFDVNEKVAKEQLVEVAESELSACLLNIKTERSLSYRPALHSAAFASETIPQMVLDTFADV